jgi:MFS transporter, DHA1 family, multidrug resistance protein
MRTQILFIIYLAALSALGPFSIDTYLPSMPHIASVFGVSSVQIQLTLSLFFVSFAIAQLVWGPLSDRYGRVKILYAGLVTYIIGSFLCALSTSITILILCRVVQGIGACSCIVLGMTMIKDRYTEHAVRTKVLSIIVSTMMVAPMIAPIIGGYIFTHISWQAIFYFLVFYGVMLFMGSFFIQESHHSEHRKKLSVLELINAYRIQICHKPFLFSVLACSTNFSVMFSFIAASSFVYINIYHVPTHLFGYYFAMNAAALILGSMSIHPLQKIMKQNVLMTFVISIIFLGSLLMLFMLNVQPNSIWSVVVPCFVMTYGVGILYPLLTSLSLGHIVEHAGLSSSLLGTMRFALVACVCLVVGLMIHNSAVPLALIMLVLNIMTGVCCLFYYRSCRHIEA